MANPNVEYGSVVQLVRMPDCLSGGRGFESLRSRHTENPKNKECGATVANPVRWPPIAGEDVDGGRQMRVSNYLCNQIIIETVKISEL